jgi:hypothetical protein
VVEIVETEELVGTTRRSDPSGAFRRGEEDRHRRFRGGYYNFAIS